MDNLDPKEAPFDLAAEEATKLLRAAHVAQMRGDVAAAEDRIRQALQIKPDDAEAHNVLGEMLLARAEAAGALEQFKRARELAPENGRYEDGFAKATLAVAEIERKKAMALSAAASGSAPVAPRNPILATMASLFIAGAGQLLNGQIGKAVLFLVLVYGLSAISMALGGYKIVTWAHQKFQPQIENTYDVDRAGEGSGIKIDVRDAISPVAGVLSVLSMIAYIWNLIDAAQTANRLNREESARTGWEV